MKTKLLSTITIIAFLLTLFHTSFAVTNEDLENDYQKKSWFFI